MTDYGQLLPNRVVHLTDQTNMSKAMLSHVVARALVQLGMVPISSWNTYDVTDPANAEFGTPGQGYQGRNFFFDFPTNETFVVDGVPYRPCLSMHAHTTDVFGQVDSTNAWTKSWGLQLGVRRADRLSISDFRTTTYFALFSTNFGNYPTDNSQGLSTYKFGMNRRFKEGGQNETAAPYWRPFAASSMTANTQVVGHNFKSIYLYLGKAGLFCFIGSALTGPAFGDILSAGIIFAGGRIPGRGRVPAQDPNLNRINPTLELPMFNGASTTDYWDGTRLINPILFMQHDLKVFNTTPAYCYIYNLENVEQPIFPSLFPHVLRSPRLVNGAGAFILSRPVIVPLYAYNDSSKYAGPIDPQITGSAVRPQWADVFTAQNFRFGDRTTTTPVEYTDPLTSKKWFLVYAQNTNMAYALDYDGRTIATALVPAPTRTLYETIDVDFSVGGLAGPFPAGVTVTTGGIAPFWTAVSGQNELQVINNSNSSSPNHFVTITYTPPVTDDISTSYVVELETKSPATSTNGLPYVDTYHWDIVGSVIQDRREILTSTPSDPQYNYRNLIIQTPIQASIGALKVEVNFFNQGYVVTVNPRIRNFKIKKYRLV